MPMLAALIIFAAIFCLVLGLSKKPSTTLSARIATLRGGTLAPDIMNQRRPESFGDRLIGPLAQQLGVRLQGLLPTSWIQALDTKLEHAGEPTTIPGFLIMTCTTMAGGFGLGFLLVGSAGMAGTDALMVLGGLVFLGGYAPRMWLSGRVKGRQKKIALSLPDAFDLIVVCVEAGLGLEAGLARVAEKIAGPFGEELALALREVSMGKLRREALKEMAIRCGVADLSGFINAVVQAEQMGTSIGTVLRIQAEQMRVKRRQRAEQQAHAAAIKMMFPLVLCILPTLFLVILGPAAINIYHQFINGAAK